MARAGRKSKPGKRYGCGKRKPVADLRFDKGSEHTQAMQALYGADGSDALGRAYRTGLLGDLRTEGAEAKALLDTGRRLHNAYWQAYATGTYQCALAERTHGSVVDLDHERIKRRETWLSDSLTFVRSMGPAVERSFRRLVLDVHPDNGPDFLDRLCWAARQDVDVPRCDPDAKALRAALDALEQLVG